MGNGREQRTAYRGHDDWSGADSQYLVSAGRDHHERQTQTTIIAPQRQTLTEVLAARKAICQLGIAGCEIRAVRIESIPCDDGKRRAKELCNYCAQHSNGSEQ